MVQFSQTSWLEFSLPNVMETLQYAPMNLSIEKFPILHYTLPSSLRAGEMISYHIQYGFKVIRWTGKISSMNDHKITVRLDQGPFRGFTASHQFVSEGVSTACYDEFSFQGFTSTIPEDVFRRLISKTNVIYGIKARKDTRDILHAVETQKKTQAFTAVDQSAAAG